MDLSIVIPIYNESEKIKHDILAAISFLIRKSLSGEILVVDDGSTDGSVAVIQDIQPEPNIPVRILRYEKHRGKGFAVRTGITQSKGEIVMFIDSGMTIPYDFILDGLHLLESGRCEIAHASRKLSKSAVHRPHKLSRRISSWFFLKMIYYWFHLPSDLTDTQCGFKMYIGPIGHELYAACQTDGFLFDIEIILRAQKKGYCIREFPIEWTADPDSRLSLQKVPIQLLKDVWRIKQILAESE